MFAKRIIDSDAFLDLPISAQALYFHLAMRADDEGFIDNAKKIMRMVRCNEDDLNLLILKRYVVPFETGVMVIRHWLVHNLIRSDRFQPTDYKNEKAQLIINDDKTYSELGNQMATTWQPNDNQWLTQDRIGKDRIGKDIEKENKEKEKRFAPPSVEEVDAYIKEQGYSFDAESFVDFYSSKGWKVGSQPMKDWKAACRTWQRRRDEDKKKDAEKNKKPGYQMHDDAWYDEFLAASLARRDKDEGH